MPAAAAANKLGLVAPPPASSATARGTIRRVADLLARLDPAQVLAVLDADGQTPIGRPRSDSRAVEAGDCFIARRGLSSDGHDFVARSVAAGASVLVLERELAEAAGVARVLVRDSTAVLPILAAGWNAWPGEALALAGITGTNGKTSTAHLLAGILTAAGRPHLRLGTTGNWLVDHEASAGFTTPFPIELQALLADARDRGATHGVMEVSSHAIVQGRAEPLLFRAVGLTSFSQDHLDFHATMAAYLAAKCELARRYCARDGLAAAPLEQGDAAATFLAAAAEAGVTRRWQTARTDDRRADIAVVSRAQGLGGFTGELRTPAGPLTLRTELVGAHNLDNAMIAVALALGLGLERDAIERGLAGRVSAPGRLERVAPEPGGHAEAAGGPAVYVDYAHTPDAVARVLEALRPIASARGGRLTVVVGCGGDRYQGKRPQMGALASRGADRFYATSDNPRTEDPEQIVAQMVAGALGPAEGGAELIREVDRAAAIARAIEDAAAEDVVLLAGKGHEDYQILGTRKIDFDDREHARAALRRPPGPSS